MRVTVSRREFLRLGAGATALAATGALPAVLSACNTTRPPNPSSPAPADVSQLYEAAKKEGSLIWWTAQYSQSAAEKMRDAFKAKFPGIEVQLLRRTAQVLYQQLTDGLKAGLPVVDVFASTDESHYPPLKKLGALAA